MITENLSTLKIHKLTQEQYNNALAAGTLDPNAIYLTPDEEVDLSKYATKDDLDEKIANLTTDNAIIDVIELTSPNGTRFRFTVSDDGTLTSTVVTE